MSENTDVSDIIDLAISAAEPDILDDDHFYSLVIPAGSKHVVVDLEEKRQTPWRKRGTVEMHEAPSLAAYVKTHFVPMTTAFYADVDTATVTAVLNGHQGPHLPGAGWGDHRAVLTLRKTVSWQHWAGKDRQWMSQVQFAQHIEEGVPDIWEPPAADMLEIAQTFQATSKVNFKSSNLLSNGQRQFAYEETMDSRAGQKGTMQVPQTFTLGVVPFEGQTEGYKLVARLQHRISDGELSLRYLLDRPHDVLKAAFGDVVGEVEQAVGLVAYRGTPPVL